MGLLIEKTLIETIDKEKIAIDRVLEFKNTDDDKNILAFSGGKDSISTYWIMVKSGVKFTPIYSPVSVDPPELIHFIKFEFNKWAEQNGYPKVKFNKYNTWKTGEKAGQIKTMWSLLDNRAIPATRQVRWCCSELKERTGNVGDHVFTGVRWEESNTRKQQKMVNFWMGKIMVRPIVDWTKEEVWELINKYNLPYPCLYDKGWDRVGCIGCPLGKDPGKELEMYPKYKKLYIKHFEKMIEYRKSKGIETEWETGEDVYKWWVGEATKNKELEGQCSMFGDL